MGVAVEEWSCEASCGLGFGIDLLKIRLMHQPSRLLRLPLLSVSATVLSQFLQQLS